MSLNKADYPVFPDADAGADPSVPAEQGGKGFTGKGWETNTDFDLIGDPHAVKGGVLREWTIPIFPARCAWPVLNGIRTVNYEIFPMVYETPASACIPRRWSRCHLSQVTGRFLPTN